MLLSARLKVRKSKDTNETNANSSKPWFTSLSSSPEQRQCHSTDSPPFSSLLRVHPDGAQRDGLQTGGGETERASRGPHAAQPPQSCPVLPAAEPEWGAGHGPASSSVLPQPGDLEIWQVNWKISIWSKCDSRPPSRESWTAPQTFPQGFQWTLNEWDSY